MYLGHFCIPAHRVNPLRNFYVERVPRIKIFAGENVQSLVVLFLRNSPVHDRVPSILKTGSTLDSFIASIKCFLNKIKLISKIFI